MEKKKLLLAWEIFIVVAFIVWLVAIVLSLPQLLAGNDRFQLFMRIMQVLLFPILLYQITPQLRSRFFSRNAKNNAAVPTDEKKH